MTVPYDCAFNGIAYILLVTNTVRAMLYDTSEIRWMPTPCYAKGECKRNEDPE